MHFIALYNSIVQSPLYVSTMLTFIYKSSNISYTQEQIRRGLRHHHFMARTRILLYCVSDILEI